MTQAGYTPPQKSAPTRANPPGKPKKPKKSRKRKRGIGAAGIVSLVIFLIAVLIGSCALFLYAQTAPYSDTFLPGTTVSGYALGGLTAQEGAAALAMLTDDAVPSMSPRRSIRSGRLAATGICSRAIWRCCPFAGTDARKSRC